MAGYRRSPASSRASTAAAVSRLSACFRAAQPVPAAVHLRHARGCPEPVAVAVEKIPVERVERAGVRSRCAPSRRSGSRRNGPTSGRYRRPTRHRASSRRRPPSANWLMPMRVRRFDPFIGVGVDRQIPVVDLVGIDAREQREIAGHHQPLDMMGVGLVERGRDRLAACRPCRSRRSSRTTAAGGRAEGVAPRVVRAPQPVDAAHVFAPAEDLPDEALDGVERRAAGALLAPRRGGRGRAGRAGRR